MHKVLTVINIVILVCIAALLTAVMVIGIVSGSFPLKSLFVKETVTMEIGKADKSQIENIKVISKDLTCVVYTTNDDDIKVELQTNYSEEKRAEVTALQNGSTYNIEVKNKMKIGVFFGTEYLNIYIPKSYDKNIDLTSGSGSIRFDDSADALSLKNAVIESSSGSVRVNDITAENYSLKSRSGSIHAANVTGSGVMESTSGSIHVESVKGGRHSLSSTSGSVHAGVIEGEYVEIKSTSGSVNAETIIGDSYCKSNSGSVKIGSMQGKCSLSSNSGSVKVESLIGRGSAKSSSGSVKIGGIVLSGDLDLSCTSGSIKAEFAGIPSAKIEATSSSGGVHSDFEPTKKGSGYFFATLGGGEHNVKAETSSGSIRLELAEQVVD